MPRGIVNVMTNKILLNGKYKLYTFDSESCPETPSKLEGNYIEATVPGNVELDYMRAGVFGDLYSDDNLKRVAELENKDFWYVKNFSFDGKIDGDYRLVFRGVDCFAEYFLNGVKVGESDNSFIERSFDVTRFLNEGENVLAVHVYSALKKAQEYKINPYNVAFDGCYESLNVRKSPSSYGWDILPRAISGGIIKDVYLEKEEANRIEDLYVTTARAQDDVAVLVVSLNAVLENEYIGKTKLKIRGVCKDCRFDYEYPMSFTSATVYPYVKAPRLWYPKGFGEQNLYDVTVSVICDGKVIAEKSLRYGIRYAKLRYGDAVMPEGDFYVEVNGKKVRIRGVNHTPIDIFHSKDKASYRRIVADVAEMNANMIRVWGGGVYEDDEFFDLCDEYGILIWQDVMLACHAYPQTADFCEKIDKEVKAVAKRIRNHCSLLCYTGSNETDWAYVCVGLNPNDDVVTRKVVPKALYSVDPYRDYLPSTPYFSEKYYEKFGKTFFLDLDEIEENRRSLPEEHFWWHRNDFLSFKNQKHRFVAEIGYSGAPSDEVITKNLPAGTSITDDAKWKSHSFPTENDRLTGVKYLFAENTVSKEESVNATRLYQAEAYKFIAETSRIRADANGIVLWNLSDGYPIFSSSLIDYYGWKKPAYYAVKASYAPKQIIFENAKHGVNVYAVNDGAKDVSVKVKIQSKNEVLYSDDVEIQAGTIKKLTVLDLKPGEYALSELTENGSAVYNYVYRYEDKIDYEKYAEFYRAYLKNTTTKV